MRWGECGGVKKKELSIMGFAADEWPMAYMYMYMYDPRQRVCSKNFLNSL